MQNAVAALLLQSLIFGALHVFNTQADKLTLLMTLIAVTLIGALWTCVYVVSRNLGPRKIRSMR